VLLGFIAEDDPVLAMLEYVAHQMMPIAAEKQIPIFSVVIGRAPYL
jgi:hypothetical protein